MINTTETVRKTTLHTTISFHTLLDAWDIFENDVWMPNNKRYIGMRGCEFIHKKHTKCLVPEVAVVVEGGEPVKPPDEVALEHAAQDAEQSPGDANRRANGKRSLPIFQPSRFVKSPKTDCFLWIGHPHTVNDWTTTFLSFRPIPLCKPIVRNCSMAD
jgi:hypothetical protein